MRYALVNPAWNFDGSIYFGCREPHLPLEFGYSSALLGEQGHDVLLVDAQMENLGPEEVLARVREFSSDFTVISTAPSYLFWRCAPPELRVPRETADLLRPVSGALIAVGPHGSTTPRAALSKLNVNAVVMGECEDILPKLTGDWRSVSSLCYRDGAEVRVQGSPNASDMSRLPALHWDADFVTRHHHQHHRFDSKTPAIGAEMEASRGCPYRCSFCAKENFRNLYRKRPLAVILEELEGLIAQGVSYVYFIDEIFLPNRDLLNAICERDVKIGLQTRIDLWSEEMLDLLGRAGCVSIEAGVESITPEGRKQLDKNCKMSTDELAGRLIYAKQRVPFVQANLLEMEQDDPEEIERWRQVLLAEGVWANKPVPLFPYPGSPEYTRRWGAADDAAWERAHDSYLKSFDDFSDIQEERPAPLVQLEVQCRT